jgi:hypothetical protein
MMRIASAFGFTPASRSRICSLARANSLLLDAETQGTSSKSTVSGIECLLLRCLCPDSEIRKSLRLAFCELRNQKGHWQLFECSVAFWI